MGFPGKPSCPARKKVSRGGMENVLERRMPVSVSPFGRLERNEPDLPSAEARFWTAHGLAEADFPSTGRFTQVICCAAALRSLPANRTPQARVASVNLRPRVALPSCNDLNKPICKSRSLANLF